MYRVGRTPMAPAYPEALFLSHLAVSIPLLLCTHTHTHSLHIHTRSLHTHTHTYTACTHTHTHSLQTHTQPAHTTHTHTGCTDTYSLHPDVTSPQSQKHRQCYLTMNGTGDPLVQRLGHFPKLPAGQNNKNLFLNLSPEDFTQPPVSFLCRSAPASFTTPEALQPDSLLVFLPAGRDVGT